MRPDQPSRTARDRFAGAPNPLGRPKIWSALPLAVSMRSMRDQPINPADFQDMIGREYYLPDGEKVKVEEVYDDGMTSARRLTGQWTGQSVIVGATTLSTVRPQID